MIDRADAAKTTEDRKKLLEILDRHTVTMGNPLYVPNAERITNESRLKVSKKIEPESDAIFNALKTWSSPSKK